MPDKTKGSTPSQTSNLCQHFGICGGCSLLKTDYQKQLANKESRIREFFSSFKGVSFHPIIGSPIEFNYRYKLQLPFGRRKIGRKTMATLGLHSIDKSFIVDQAECKIQESGLTKAAQAVRQWARKEGLSVYNEKKGTGILRHLVLRKSKSSGEILVTLVTNQKDLLDSKSLSKSLFMHLRSALGKNSEYGKLVGILQNTNTRNTSMVLGKDTQVLWGRPYILEKIGKWKYKVGIQNFIQVNPHQTENLYNIVLNHIKAGDRILDAYAGMGTIGIWLSEKAGSVICTEENPDSYRTGMEALKVNQIKNVRFHKGRSEDILPGLLEKEDLDVLVVDPPRVGLENRTIQSILDFSPPKIIYVSCDPETLKRDCNLLKGKYTITDIYPVDMFPHTEHLETITILKIK